MLIVLPSGRWPCMRLRPRPELCTAGGVARAAAAADESGAAGLGSAGRAGIGRIFAEEIRCAIFLKRSSCKGRSIRSKRCNVRPAGICGSASTRSRMWTRTTAASPFGSTAARCAAPARRVLQAPTRALADALAAEWNAQQELIDPLDMPLTRLANSIIDGVVDAPAAVAAEIEKYLGSDLLFYRAPAPPSLVAQAGAGLGSAASIGRARRSAPASCWPRGSISWPSRKPRSRRRAPPSRAIPGGSARSTRSPRSPAPP